MISLRRYLNASGNETPLEAVSLLVASIGSSALEGDPVDLAAFTNEIRRIGDALAQHLPADNLMIVAKAVAQALTTYNEACNKRIARLLASQGSEVRNILGMLQDAVISIAGENTRSGKRLQEITRELKESVALTDLRVLKGRLTECLKDLREETLQQKADAAVTMQKLQITIERGRSAPAAAKAANGLDEVTGLPCREDAHAAVQTAVETGTRHYAVVMVVNRVEMINARFGLDVGDRMMVGIKEHLQQQLSLPDRLYRWGGPALLAIIERPEPLPTVRVQVRRMLDARMEVIYAANGRSVLIPISAAWSVVPCNSTADTSKQSQAFIATQTTGGA